VSTDDSGTGRHSERLFIRRYDYAVADTAATHGSAGHRQYRRGGRHPVDAAVDPLRRTYRVRGLAECI
jgi:hypothetical protein